MIAMWLILALASAFFAGLTAVLAKYALDEIPSHLATAVRTTVVWVFAWGIVLTTKALNGIAVLTGETWIFLILSGLATGGSWLCYYRALQDGPVSAVVPIDKLSILFTIILSGIFLRERLSRKALGGLILLVAGTLAIALF